MAESSDMTWKSDNDVIPPFVSKDLKWFERDGLETEVINVKSFWKTLTFILKIEKLLILI